jgi:hypothetical protein
MNGAWSAPELFALDAERPDVAIDRAGNAVVVGMSRTPQQTSVVSRRYTAGVGWSDIQVLDTLIEPGFVGPPPKVATDANGTAMAVWVGATAAFKGPWTRRFD